MQIVVDFVPRRHPAPLRHRRDLLGLGDFKDAARGDVEDPARGDVEDPARGDVEDAARGDVEDAARGPLGDAAAPCRASESSVAGTASRFPNGAPKPESRASPRSRRSSRRRPSVFSSARKISANSTSAGGPGPRALNLSSHAWIGSRVRSRCAPSASRRYRSGRVALETKSAKTRVRQESAAPAASNRGVVFLQGADFHHPLGPLDARLGGHPRRLDRRYIGHSRL